DGSNEMSLLNRSPDVHFDNPAWSRDGRSIALVSRQGYRRGDYQLFSVAVENQTEIQISSQRWSNVLGLVWLADGKGLIMTASAPGGSQQLWHISYPDGAARMISADTNQYISILSITADAKVIVSTVVNLSQTLWIVGDEDFANAREIKGRSNCTNPTWTADGQIVFTSRASGNQDIWMMQADGANQRQLTVNEASDRIPAVSPDGSYMVFVSTRSGTENIWRMNLDGSNPLQLSKGKSDTTPSFSPDGKWLFYTSVDNEPTLWKVPADGGDSVQVTQTYSSNPAVSPDGKLLACLWKSNKSDSFPHIAVLPVAGGVPVKLFAAKANGYVRWTSDGRALFYTAMENDVANIWTQPLDGSPPTQITKFTEGSIAGFDISPDGKQIICAHQINDFFLALIKDAE
ncbi:MAG TPA: LpqB family beta-propeller domain-containing protein, partial [Blastocatellia bacterium]|nr:LpqB family beta-propeller domain-containing protein [Blastocatellia bacterium]